MRHIYGPSYSGSWVIFPTLDSPAPYNPQGEIMTQKQKIMDYLRDIDRSRNPLHSKDLVRIETMLNQVVECDDSCGHVTRPVKDVRY